MRHTGHNSQRRLQHSIDIGGDDFIIRESIVVADTEGTGGGVDIDVHEALDAVLDMIVGPMVDEAFQR